MFLLLVINIVMLCFVYLLLQFPKLEKAIDGIYFFFIVFSKKALLNVMVIL